MWSNILITEDLRDNNFQVPFLPAKKDTVKFVQSPIVEKLELEQKLVR